MSDLDEVIRERRSTRMFLPDPVPRHLVDEAVELAMRAPSNSNMQPWDLVFASGAARDRLVKALLVEAESKPPLVPALPAAFAHLRGQLGVGMFVQTLLLALTERGLGTCVQVSIAGYPEILREQLGIAAELSILCGLAVGYPDPAFPGNKVRIGRHAVEQHVRFVET